MSTDTDARLTVALFEDLFDGVIYGAVNGR